MAKISDSELVQLIEGGVDRYLSAPNIDVANVKRAVADAVALALRDAGVIVIREERNRHPSNDAAVAALARLRQAAAA